MDESEKYRQFRNMMFNELGITKHDIRMWVREAVQEQVEQMIAQSHDLFDPKMIAQEAARKAAASYGNYSQMGKMVREEIAKTFADKFTITLKEDK